LTVTVSSLLRIERSILDMIIYGRSDRAGAA